MKGLAAFVMRGRLQASGVAALVSALPLLSWLGASIVALVVLRRGNKEGFLVFLWAFLPLVLVYQTGGDSSGLIALLGAFLTAMALRSSVSWVLTLYAVVIAAVIGSLVFMQLSESILTAFVDWYVDVMESLAADTGAPVVTPAAGQRQAVSYLAMGQGYMMVLALMLARWWQSVLYNPGGFKQEVQQTRLTPKASLPLVLVMAGCLMTDGFGTWVGVVSIPFVVIGSGLVHWILSRQNRS
ncbi:MAG: hypothetical protein HOM49_04120, partial [Gammaproteobacteria bacterium]|nr:hypothetical protein [Gammaproteobacteria bacterium]